MRVNGYFQAAEQHPVGCRIQATGHKMQYTSLEDARDAMDAGCKGCNGCRMQDTLMLRSLVAPLSRGRRIQCAARITRHRAASFFLDLFFVKTTLTPLIHWQTEHQFYINVKVVLEGARYASQISTPNPIYIYMCKTPQMAHS